MRLPVDQLDLVALRIVLGELPQDECEAWFVVDVLGCTSYEAARVVGARAASTIRSRVARARVRIADALGREPELAPGDTRTASIWGLYHSPPEKAIVAALVGRRPAVRVKALSRARSDGVYVAVGASPGSPGPARPRTAPAFMTTRPDGDGLLRFLDQLERAVPSGPRIVVLVDGDQVASGGRAAALALRRLCGRAGRRPHAAARPDRRRRAGRVDTPPGGSARVTRRRGGRPPGAGGPSSAAGRAVQAVRSAIPPPPAGMDERILLALALERGAPLIRFLATPQAAEPWARAGGFISPNRAVDQAVYPDATTRRLARQLIEAEVLRFDLSDLQPLAFGATAGQGLLSIFRRYLSDGPASTAATAPPAERRAGRAPLRAGGRRPVLTALVRYAPSPRPRRRRISSSMTAR